MSKVLSTPRLTLKKNYTNKKKNVIGRKLHDFNTNTSLPQRDINILQLRNECVYMNLQHFLVFYFVLFCCWCCSLFFLYFVFVCIGFFMIFSCFLCLISFANFYNLNCRKKLIFKQEKIHLKIRASNTVTLCCTDFKV